MWFSFMASPISSLLILFNVNTVSLRNHARHAGQETGAATYIKAQRCSCHRGCSFAIWYKADRLSHVSPQPSQRDEVVSSC